MLLLTPGQKHPDLEIYWALIDEYREAEPSSPYREIVRHEFDSQRMREDVWQRVGGYFMITTRTKSQITVVAPVAEELECDCHWTKQHQRRFFRFG